MVYTSADWSPQRSQWELNSQYSQAYNCGPTGVTKVACFYKDKWLGIEATRKLVASTGRPTTYEEQRRMLIARGVPCSIRQVSSLAEMRSLNPAGRRPFLIGVQMSRVPASYRGHSFTGWHTLVVLSAPAGGFWVMESNLPVGSSSARRWYPDWLMQYAFIAPSSSIGIIPYDPKVVTAPVPPNRGKIQINQNIEYVNLRSGPGFGYAIIGSARGPYGAAGAGIYRGTRYTFKLNSVFDYIGSDAANEWRKMTDYLNRVYWVKREFTHLVT